MDLVIPADLDAAVSALKAGRPVIICDEQDREAEGDLAFAGAFCTPELVNFALSNARGLLCISMSERWAQRLGVSRLETNGLDPHGTPFGSPITLNDGSSGVSAKSRAATIRCAADPSSTANDFCRPGHVATLIAREGGVLERTGHTEAILDLQRCAGIAGPGVLCEILSPSGEMADDAHLKRLSTTYDLPIVTVQSLVEYVTRMQEKLL